MVFFTEDCAAGKGFDLVIVSSRDLSLKKVEGFESDGCTILVREQQYLTKRRKNKER